MPVGIEHVFDRFVGGFANFLDQRFRLIRETRFNHEHEVFENDPALIAADKIGFPLSLAEEDPWSQFGHGGFGWHEQSQRESRNSQKNTRRQQGDHQRTKSMRFHYDSCQGKNGETRSQGILNPTKGFSTNTETFKTTNELSTGRAAAGNRSRQRIRLQKRFKATAKIDV